MLGVMEAPPPEHLAVAHQAARRLSSHLPATGVLGPEDVHSMAVEALLVIHCDGKAPEDAALLYTTLYRRVVDALRREGVIVRSEEGEFFQPEAKSLDELEPWQRENLVGALAQEDEARPEVEPHFASARARATRALRGCSPRELDVLRLGADGLTFRETAAELGVSTETVKHHRKKVLHALGARNMAHGVTIAFRRGMLA